MAAKATEKPAAKTRAANKPASAPRRPKIGARVVAVDHISVRVTDFAASKAFYAGLFGFLGFKVMEEFDDAMGWRNPVTRFWITRASAGARR